MNDPTIITAQDRIADYIQSHPRIGPYAAASSVQGWPHKVLPGLISADELADEFLQDAEFSALRLGTWLNTTDGQLIAEAVSRVIPPGYEPVFSLTVNALEIAAGRQAELGRQRAGVITLGVLTGALLIGMAVWEP